MQQTKANMIEPKITNTIPSNQFPSNIEQQKVVGNTLYVMPSRQLKKQDIFLTKSKSAWITIEWLSAELQEYSDMHYQELFELHPAERGKVVMYGKEVNSPRWHRSYLQIPNQHITDKKSFMYSGRDFYQDLSLPSAFQVYLDFMNKGEATHKFNQMIVNWYADGNDFIAAHSDCQIGMKPNAGISVISLNEVAGHFREMRFTAKNLRDAENDYLHRHVKIAALQGTVITMHGDIQQKFRHKVPKAMGLQSSRISLTFRKF